MKTTNNTVLITGGSAGIGFEIARVLTERGDHVIITGRDADRLNAAAAKLKNVTPIVFDVTKEAHVNTLVARIHKDFPALNILINNAGHSLLYKLDSDPQAFEKASEEIHTNYLSIVRLTEKLLPILQAQNESAVVNVSSIVSFVPTVRLAGYSASKAALHSYTQTLRLALAATSVKVFELMPPLVNTQFSQAIGGAAGIPPHTVAEALLEALNTDRYEIHVGATADIYALSRKSPTEAFAAMNATVEARS